MDFEQVLLYRQSTRRFLPKQISEDQLEKLLNAANFAPVGSSLYRDVHLTVVQNQETLLRLCEAAWKRFSSAEKVREIAGSTADATSVREGNEKPNLFYGAPTVIFVSHRKQTLQPGIEWANVSAVATQMHLAAANLGLGSCFMWGALESMRMFPELDHTALLELPEGFEPLLALAVGYATTELKPRTAPRNPISVNRISSKLPM